MEKKYWMRALYGVSLGLALSASVYAVSEPVQVQAEEMVTSDTTFDRSQLVVGDQTTIEGLVVSDVNAWGGNSFFVQADNQQGLFIYPKDSLGVEKGERVRLTGRVEEYSGALQLTTVTDAQILSNGHPVEASLKTLADVKDELQGSYIALENVTVSNLKSVGKYQNSSFTITDQAGLTLPVFVDNRSGATFSDVSAKIKDGDQISVKGILYANKGHLELKPYRLEDIAALGDNDSNLPMVRTVANIGEIQGESHTSPLVGQKVQIKDVVVTKVDGKKGFYIQDLHPDGNDKTSDGLYVVSKEAVTVGDQLEVIGEVLEQTGDGYADKDETDLTITQLKSEHIQKIGVADLPKALMLDRDRKIPRKNIDNDSLTEFQPEEDAIDFWESLEGMLVEVEKPRVLGPQLHGEIYVLPQSYHEQELNSADGVSLHADYPNTEVVGILVGNRRYRAKAKDYFTENIKGTVTYSYGAYKVDAAGNLPEKMDGGLEREVSTLLPEEHKLLVASYNIENFSANGDAKETPEDKVEKIARSLIHEIHSPDIVSLIEVQDDNGGIDDGTVSGVKSGARLSEKIRQLGGPSYKYVEVTPENNADGGKPGANIRVAFLYNPARVTLVDKAIGGSQEAARFVNGSLEKNPSRIDPTNPAFTNVRKSLAAEFEFKGERVVVIANHLKSKRGDDSLYGASQPALEHSQAARIEQARILNQFVQEGLAQNPNLKFVLTGDFNDFEFSQTIQALEGDTLVNLLSGHDFRDRYSYFFRGNQQSLDNILVSKNIADKVAFDAVHVNSSFMAEDGRASDHDPLVVQITFGKGEGQMEDTLISPEPSSQEGASSQQTNSSSTSASFNFASSEEWKAVRLGDSSLSSGKARKTHKESDLYTSSVKDQGESESKKVARQKILPKTGEKSVLFASGGVLFVVLGTILAYKKKHSV
ncbi:endonuclease/exonuclease/phosphatase family protein [Streptococcus himalayensis]|uniref:Nuclease n=1 Tax=Streptococcus himalayensis TaxID=1888195 RepID=A0A917A605_9STRE|nr:endonuclease/exonuclease/phosphatase family protein [Streptococcus himalayensis]GGE29392.1 nuclease [Streptococcus himalayensis]